MSNPINESKLYLIPKYKTTVLIVTPIYCNVTPGSVNFSINRNIFYKYYNLNFTVILHLNIVI